MKRPSLRAVLVLLCCALVASCDGCTGCGEEPAALAVLSAMDGDGVQRDYAASVGKWEQAKVGARFSLGDGLQTIAPSQAMLDLSGSGQLRVRPGSRVRFLVDGAGAGESAIDVQTGEALLMSGMAELRLRTHVGLAVIAPGARILLARIGDSMDYSVEVGEARFRSAGGEEVVLKAGESMGVEIGMASLRKKSGAPEPVTPVTDAGAGTDIDIGAAVIRAKVESDGVMMRANVGDAWLRLDKGERELPPGTHLKLPAGTAVELSRGDDKARLTGSGEFVLGAGTVLVDTKHGGVHVDAARNDVEIIVPGGSIVARGQDGGSSAQVNVGATSGTVIAERGTIAFKAADETIELAAGGQHEFAVEALAEQPDEPSSVAPGPDYASFGVRAGESFVVHAPEVPVAIAFDASHKCNGEVALELAAGPSGKGRQRGTGPGRANLLFPTGTRGYTARCVDAKGGFGQIVARGSVQVLQDAGTRKLPPRAPTSEVEADGRTYSVYYQNQLPDIRIRWPNAPNAAQFTLEVDGKAQPLDKPEHVFRSGSLRDGTHQLAFMAGERRSRTTTVEVSFDNTAPTASLSAPSDRSFSPGETVLIEGVVLPSWKVTIDGGTITMEGTERFVGEVATSAAKPDVAVRLTHPRLGTHYYLRRAAGSR